jgi:hypothetical protein
MRLAADPCAGTLRPRPSYANTAGRGGQSAGLGSVRTIPALHQGAEV